MKPGVLSSLRGRLGLWLGARLFLWILGLAAGSALAAVLLDVVFDLPDDARALAPWLLAGSLLLLAGAAGWRWARFGEARVARLFERADPALGSRLINAVQLSARSASTGVEEFLRQETIRLGQNAAAGVDVWPAVRQGVKWAAGLAGAALLAWLGLWMTSGDLLRAVGPRFLDPHGDHPPYSRLHLGVTPGKTEVLFGGQVEVRASVGGDGAGADKLWLVARSGTNELRAMMFLAPDKTFFQTLANLREPTEYFVTDGRARSHRFPIGIRYTPQISLVEVTTTYPQYTGKPVHTAKLAPDPQALPEDTRVSFRVVSNRPLKSGELTLTPVLGGKVQHVELKRDTQENVVTGGFTLAEPVVFSISVRDVAGLVSADPREGRFNLLPDERPRIFVLEPGRDAVATPSIRVPVRVEATDDYGVTRVAWLRGFNRSIERPFAMQLTLKSGPTSVEASGAFDFARLGVRPGDVIDYYFEAADNYPKGPNLALSRMYHLQIISQEQYEAILRQAAAQKALFEPYFQLDAWLRRLAERARDAAKQAESGSAEQKAAAAKEAADVAADLAKYEAQLGKLLEEATLFDVEQAFRTTMVAQHTRVGQAREKMGAALTRGTVDPKKLAEAASDLSDMAQSADQDVDIPAREIAQVAQVLARADVFVKLAHQQAALAQVLRRFSDRSGDFSRTEQMELQELAYQQRRVQEGLQTLMESLPDLLGKLPLDERYDPLRGSVNAFLQAVAEAKIEDDLVENGKNLAVPDGKAAFVLAQQAAEKMDRLISKCQGLPKQGKMCLQFKPSVQQALGNTLEQILAAMGAKPGNGQGGSDGYAMFNDDVALYGPNVELAGQQAGGRTQPGPTTSRRAEQVPGQTRDAALAPPPAPGRVHLQPDAKFPLRYRDLIGEYFKVIGESETISGGKP